MIFQLILFLLLLISLFLLSQKIQTKIYTSIFVITKSKNFAIGVLIVLLFPGTIIHELAHFLVATILRVPTGELTVIPTIEKSGSSSAKATAGEEVKAGRLLLAETDPFRLSLIGLAPIFIGLILIYLIGKTFSPYLFLSSFTPGESIRLPQGWFSFFVFCYLLFVISLTMFSSKKDLQGVIIAGPISLILIIALYFIGVRVFLENNFWPKIEMFLTALNNYLLITAFLDCMIFLFLSLNLSLCKKILRKIGSDGHQNNV